MRVEKYNINTLDRELLAEEHSVTIVTAQGEFSIREEEDGALAIHESTHYHLSIRPKTSNSVVISAVSR